MDSLDPRIRRADLEASPASGGLKQNEHWGMNIYLNFLSVVAMLLTIGTSDIRAQMLDPHAAVSNMLYSDPECNFGPGVVFRYDLSIASLNWIRKHRPKSVFLSGTCGNVKFPDSLRKFTFEYPGDTLMMTAFDGIGDTMTAKYDRNDTLRFRLFETKGLRKTEEYDSRGRGLRVATDVTDWSKGA